MASRTLQPNDSDFELLSAYIDSRLSEQERLALEERLHREAALRVSLDELRGTVALLRDLEPVRPPRSFTLDPAAVAPARSGWHWRSWLGLGSSLAAVALVVLCVFLAPLAPANNANAPMAAAPTAPAAAAPQAAIAPTAVATVSSTADAARITEPSGAAEPAAGAAPAPEALAPKATGVQETAPMAAQEAAPTGMPDAPAAPPNAELASPQEQPAVQPTLRPTRAPAAPAGGGVAVVATPPVASPAISSPDTTRIDPQAPQNSQAPLSPGVLAALIGMPLAILAVALFLWYRRR